MAYFNLNLAGHSGALFTHRADAVQGNNYQLVKLVFGGEGVASEITAGTPLPVSQPGADFAGGSSTITTGGTAQTVFPANPSRRLLIVQNTDDNEGLSVTLTSAETPSATVGLVIAPGQGIRLQGPAPTGIIRVWGATTGNRFVAYEA